VCCVRVPWRISSNFHSLPLHASLFAFALGRMHNRHYTPSTDGGDQCWLT
jgi:hypothetical protein